MKNLLKWHSLQPQEVVQQLGTDPEHGLGDDDAKRRLEKFGSNQLKEKEESLVETLLEPFTEPTMILLIVTGIVYSFFGEPRDAVAIFTIIAIIGFVEVYQERRAEKSIHALKKLTTPLAKLIRDSRERKVLSTEIVPGDLIILEAGDKVPADARLIEAINLRVEESLLTGESSSVEKDAATALEDRAIASERRNMVFAGTTVVHGKAKAIIVATGMRTEMGKIAGLMQEVKEKPTPLQEKMKQLTGWFVLVSLSLCAIVVIGGLVQGDGFIQTVLFGLSLAVATIPEDLPIILTVILVMGVRRIAKRHALIKKMYSVETLGSATVICADKTGTLTQNRMTVVSVYTDNKTMKLSEIKDVKMLSQTIDAAFKIGVLCNDARIERSNTGSMEFVGDPTEKALIVAAYEAGMDINEIRADNRQVAEYSFDNKRKLMSTVYMDVNKKQWVFTKGAPEELLSRSSHILHDGEVKKLSEEDKEKVLDANVDMAKDGLRVIGVGFKALEAEETSSESEDVEHNLVFVALIGMVDPPREDAKMAISECQSAGIKIVMITGDQKFTALAIANELGLDHDRRVLTGQELDEMGEEELEKVVRDVDVYARVSPEHKLMIVRALKKSGEVVAMTGDGINDAPALKEADIGIAMGETGTDVAREASAMVLADDDFATITEAIKEGRAIFDNLKKAIAYYTSSKVAVLAIGLTTVLLGLPLPLLPIQIILMEALTDLIASMSFEAEIPEADLMKRPPQKRGGFVFSRKQQLRIFVQGFIIVASVLFVYTFILNQGLPLEEARSAAFATTLFSIVFLAFNSRSETRPLFRLGLLSNKNIVAFGLLALIAAVLAVQLPPLQPFFKTATLTPLNWTLILAMSFLSSIWIEIGKIKGQMKKIPN